MIHPSILDDSTFWSRLGEARHRFLGLDYDGTIAPFRVERMAALPYPGVVEELRALGEDPATRLVVISGRLVEEVHKLLGDIGVTLVGSHGCEVRDPQGKISRAALRPAQELRLRHAEQELRDLGRPERIERKAASIAFHTRGLEEGEAASLVGQVRERWSAGALESGLSCRPFDIEGTADALHAAFVMGREERRARRRRLQRNVSRYTVFWWVDSFLRAAISRDLDAFPQGEYFVPQLAPGEGPNRQPSGP